MKRVVAYEFGRTELRHTDRPQKERMRAFLSQIL